ncbi:hypothetical protein GCM10007415_12170 [Parapedobacter pyrenivorans]|uniref:DUF3823 domain-containing protein n=1 Tax=Parapedobacter pyrenivorans TaxID=1305674 RepID=A0A917HJA2_9SPHI|nr:DUF3823 domain-containing protein [Parapedobacter pyrenivorans]GGG81159.1 hypothetical protein GCM10007415_12170 [Parapedobacter pyrenivorans]
MKAKKIITYVLSGLLCTGLFSCQKLDNYAPPSETLQGRVIDKATKAPIQTEMGDRGIRLRLLELSWSDNPTPYFFTCMQDGTFNNTKIFKGNYNVVPQGPFVPLILRDGNGDIITDESQTVDIEGVTDLTFEVEPFLNVEWVGEPVLNDNGSITVQVRVTRGTANPDFQQDVTEIALFINSSSYYVGDNNYDNRYTVRITGTEANGSVGEVVTLTTQDSFSMNRDYYVRVGARIDYNVEGAQRFNYNEPKKVAIL